MNSLKKKVELSKILESIEVNKDTPKINNLLDEYHTKAKAHVVGITGPPGVGKSSLINALIKIIRHNNFSVGVIAVDPSSRLATLNEIIEVTTKPIIYDADTGGKPEHFAFTVKNLERLGVSAVIIEDKTGLKKNSLLGNDVKQTQADIHEFSQKISAAKQAQVTDDFMVIARIESLILNSGIDDALKRAEAFIAAGADGIMIHSRQKDPKEIFEFIERYNKFENRKTLVCVPSSYSQVREDQLLEKGVNIVIYANQLLRSAYPAMINTAKSILHNGRSAESDSNMMSIKEILNLIPGTN